MRAATIFTPLGRRCSNARRMGHACLAGLFTLGIVLVVMTQAQAQDATGFAGAIRMLAREQSLAESYVVLLKEFGKEDVEKYARGIQLYARAKAEYDGLIEQMKHHLTMGRPFDASPEFKLALNNAADHRIALQSSSPKTSSAMTRTDGPR